MHHGSVGAPKKAVAGGDKVGDWKTERNDGNGEAGALGGASMASPSVSSRTGMEAVVFSIQFYGKTIGEVGLMDQDLSELDWTKFKSYIFQNLLSINHQENICVSYSDDEGDKLPIESDEEYREALKVAKKKAEAHDKLVLDITRQGSFPTVFSIVSSGIKRVSSSPPKEGGISFFKTASPPKESSSFGGRSGGHDKKIFPSLFSSDRGDGEVSGGGARPKETGSYEQPPKWFIAYMNKFREELCEDVVTKLAHVMREELTVSSKAEKEKPREYTQDNELSIDVLASKTVTARSDLLDYSQTFEFPQAEFKEPEFNNKNLRAESDTQKDCSQPTQLEVSSSPAYDFPLPALANLKDDSAKPYERSLARKYPRKSSNHQQGSSFQLGEDHLKDCSQPTELEVNCPPAYDFSIAALAYLKDDSAKPYERYLVRKYPRKSSNPQKRNSFQFGKGHIKEKTSNIESNATKKGDSTKKDNEKKSDLQSNNPQKRSAKKDNERKGGDLQSSNPQKRGSFQITFAELIETSDEKTQDLKSHYKKKDGGEKENVKTSDSGVKRKKSGKEEERFSKWLEKMEEKMAKKQGKIEERFSKKQEKLEERHVKRQEKLAERFQKQQEKAEKRRTTSNCSRLLEMEKGCRTQGKVLAKMEGLRKKQSCSPEELSKLRKVVDKHHRAADKYYDGVLADYRHLKLSDRKIGRAKAGKSRKIDIESKAYPVDALLLHKALLELEALTEDSPSEGQNSATLGYDAFYVNDVTYPDGSQVPPGAHFIKTWRVLNSGGMPWNEKTELCKWTQVQFQGSSVDWKLKPLEKKVVCPPLKPGECGNISITFIAPEEPGWYATHWRFCQQGHVFGNQIWCAVYVSNNTDSDSESQTKLVVNKTDSESAQVSTEEENEVKDCEEQSSTEEQSSEEDVPNFVDAAKDMSIVKSATTECSANSTSDDIPEPQTEPDSHEEEACQHSEYEVGIIENYYDAEDPAEEDDKCVDASGQDSANVPEATAKLNSDLISFEEEAELVPSGTTSPNVADTYSVVFHSVMPLKDMARESVDSLKDILKDSVVVKDERWSHNVPLEANALDELSISSGSFSDLDSEDQAILNESDTDVSDHSYFVVTMPECFDLTLPYASVSDSSQLNALNGTTNSIPEAERHDSPDFLTADEDDRTTTAANCMKYQNESLTSNRSTVDDNEVSSHAESVLENPLSIDAENRGSQFSRSSKATGDCMPSLPHPPTETKGFMDIPPEALRANLALSLYKENSTRPEAEQQLKHQESGQANWGSGTEERQEVVCEQPVSAQMKAGVSPQCQSKSSPSACGMAEKNMGQGTVATAATSTHDQLTGEGAAALPDELVSIIPEDLVRGVWNTARTFITRINQEMLSPSANGPVRVGDTEVVAVSGTPTSPTQDPPQKEERRNEASSTATPEVGEEPSSLPPPLQQLADMGFSNHEVNQCLLTKYNNDVACAVAELIVLNCQ